MSEMSDSVQSVNIYPFKSLQSATVNGVAPLRLPVGEPGFEVISDDGLSVVRDRDFVLFDPAEGVFVSQRGWDIQGRKVKFPGDKSLAGVGVDIKGDHIAINAPDFGSTEVPTEVQGGKPDIIDIFGKQFPVVRQKGEAVSFFSKLLGRDLELYRADRSQDRELPERYSRPGASNKVAGADGFPFLLLSQASLDAQHIRNGIELGTVPINRYRGNIIIGGFAIGAFMEDYISALRLGRVSAEIVKACARCPIPNIDQYTGEHAGGESKVLRGRAGVADSGSVGVFFGQNLNHQFIEGQTIGVGDPVQILSKENRPNVTLRAA